MVSPSRCYGSWTSVFSFHLFCYCYGSCVIIIYFYWTPFFAWSVWCIFSAFNFKLKLLKIYICFVLLKMNPIVFTDYLVLSYHLVGMLWFIQYKYKMQSKHKQDYITSCFTSFIDNPPFIGALNKCFYLKYVLRKK